MVFPPELPATSPCCQQITPARLRTASPRTPAIYYIMLLAAATNLTRRARSMRGLGSMAMQHASPYLHDLVGDQLQPGILGGYGVKAVALVDVAEHSVIFRESGEIYSQPSMHSIQIGVASHCQIDGEGRFTAHSFSPNLAVVVSPREPEPIKFVALRAIIKGEELSFDYTTTEWELEDGGFVDATTNTPVRGTCGATGSRSHACCLCFPCF